MILEPATGTTEPEPGYLQGVRELCDSYGAILIFDEIVTGFRWATGGAQSLYGVTPDLSTWGKALARNSPGVPKNTIRPPSSRPTRVASRKPSRTS